MTQIAKQPDQTTPTVVKQRLEARQVWGDVLAVIRAHWYFRHVSHLGKRVRVWGRPVIRNSGTMLIGERVRLVSTITPIELATGSNGTLELGEGVYINYGCSIAASQLIRLGSRCNI